MKNARKSLKILENARKFKNSPIFLELLFEIYKIFKLFWKITIENYSFFELWLIDPLPDIFPFWLSPSFALLLAIYGVS